MAKITTQIPATVNGPDYDISLENQNLTLLEDGIPKTTVNIADDQLLEIGSVSVVGNTLTIQSSSALINGIEYEIIIPTNINVPYTTLGYNRIDIIEITESSTYIRKQGIETLGVAIQPIKDDNTVIAVILNVFDNTINNEVPPVGDDYEFKNNKTGIVIGNETSTTLYLHIAGVIAYFQRKLTDSIFGTFITSLTAKTTIVDADTSVVSDSADANKAKKVTWVNIFNYIKLKLEIPLSYACSDEVSDLAVGTLITFRMPISLTLTGLKLSLNTAPTGTKLIVDVRKNGVTILSTLISVDISSTTSVGASVPYIISDSNLIDDSIITILTTQVGSTIAGKGLKVTFLGKRI